MMSHNNPEIARKTIIVISCGFLVVVSILTFREQIPTITPAKIYDKEYLNVLRNIGNLIPQNETLTSTTDYPQLSYFTDHKVKVPWNATSEKSIVRFMWKINSSYLLVDEGLGVQGPDDTPMLIQLVEKPLEKVFDYYYDYISAPKGDNSTVSYRFDGKQLEKLFEKIINYNTKINVLHLYRIRSNITQDNLDGIVIDNKRPILFVSQPVNGTIMESKSDVLQLNITGTAMDAESKIKKVEISVNGSAFQLAKPRTSDDWSTWSSSHIFTAEGTKKIVARATDNAENKRWFPIQLTIR